MRLPRFFTATTLVASLAISPLAAAVGALPSSDGELARAVQELLARDREVRDLDLMVRADSGVVTLSGRIPRLDLQRAVIRLAAGQRGVLEIRDELLLDAGPAADRTVLLRIESRLAAYVDFREPTLRVTVQDGVACPAGQVGTIGRLLFLQELLAGIRGVRGVDLTGVQVETELRRAADDEVIRDGILALLRNPLIFPVSGRIQVEVADAQVTLSGEVPRLIDRMEAEFVAGLVGGVRGVENQLQVDPQQGRMRVRDFSGD